MDIKKVNDTIKEINTLGHQLKTIINGAKDNALELINEIPKAEIPPEEFDAIKQHLVEANNNIDSARSDAENAESDISSAICIMDDASFAISDAINKLVKYNESDSKLSFDDKVVIDELKKQNRRLIEEVKELHAEINLLKS